MILQEKHKQTRTYAVAHLSHQQPRYIANINAAALLLPTQYGTVLSRESEICSPVCFSLLISLYIGYFRDIAARNCLVSSLTCVKLSDFGLCRWVERDAFYTGMYFFQAEIIKKL